MAVPSDSSGDNIFTSETSIFSQKLYVIIITTVVLILVVFLLILLILRRNREKRLCAEVKNSSGILHLVSKENREVKASNQGQSIEVGKEIDQGETDKVSRDTNKVLLIDDVVKETDIDSNSNNRSSESNESSSSDGLGNFGWGRWFSWSELQIATDQFCSENVIGEGGYGIVYRGVLPDGSLVAVKKLRNNKLAYLHEGLEPKVVHRDMKSSNILLDRKWNPKVSDFGLAKLLGSEKSHVTTRVMGTFGYVSPDYASTGMLNEGNDVYSFGVLLMELITGRSPIDYSRPPGEMNLVEWFKGMVGSRRGEESVDPLIKVPPPPRSLKRLLLVCLRCIDMDASKRPKMGQIAHMLEADVLTLRSHALSAICIPKQLANIE
ncbi:putative receptor-like serine/threonine-protein kinase At4g34500 isoform X2 [Primulina tabacum]|uniref:putative receptor-like serine/threonine-protein kinase At4g34500 isoform X2 n=1 Tax=Primulina tabacum TaxID=48773 RepID=UPI003F5A05F2